jgi:RNA polymerase sigma-70 factor, ECF subfamily
VADIKNQVVALLPRLRRFAYALTGSRAEADDLVQSTCERALRSAELWTPGTRLDSWMFKIMQNLWRNRLRKVKTEATDPMQEGFDPAGEDGRRTIEGRLSVAEVRAAIQELPEEQRSVMLLVCVEDLSYREAAESLGVPIGTVMSRLYRARRSLLQGLGLDTPSLEAGGAA